MLETRHLEVFLAVYRCSSFTRAAELLHTSQSTVSEHIRNLETALGVKLFDRMGRTIQSTAEGDLLFQGAQKLVHEMEQLSERVRAESTTVRGTLRIGAGTTPATWLLPEAFASFQTRFPELTFHVHTADSTSIISDVERGELLLGVVGTRTASTRVEFTHLTSERLLLVAAPASPHPTAISVDTLPSLPFILREPGSGTRKTMEQHLQKSGLARNALNPVAVFDSAAAVKEAVRAGLGVSILSSHAVQRELEAGLLREIHLQSPPLERPFYLALPSGRSLPNRYTLFCRHLIASCKTR